MTSTVEFGPQELLKEHHEEAHDPARNYRHDPRDRAHRHVVGLRLLHLPLSHSLCERDAIPNTDPINHPDAFTKRQTDAFLDAINEPVIDSNDLAHAYAVGYIDGNTFAHAHTFPNPDAYGEALRYALAHPERLRRPAT